MSGCTLFESPPQICPHWLPSTKPACTARLVAGTCAQLSDSRSRPPPCLVSHLQNSDQVFIRHSIVVSLIKRTTRAWPDMVLAGQAHLRLRTVLRQCSTRLTNCASQHHRAVAPQALAILVGRREGPLFLYLLHQLQVDALAHGQLATATRTDSFNEGGTRPRWLCARRVSDLAQRCQLAQTFSTQTLALHVGQY